MLGKNFPTRFFFVRSSACESIHHASSLIFPADVWKAAMAPPSFHSIDIFSQWRRRTHLHPNWADLRRHSHQNTTESIRPSPRFISNRPSTLPRPATQPVPRVRLALHCLRLPATRRPLVMCRRQRPHATSRRQPEVPSRWPSSNHRAPRSESISLVSGR